MFYSDFKVVFGNKVLIEILFYFIINLDLIGFLRFWIFFYIYYYSWFLLFFGEKGYVRFIISL